MIPNGQFFYSSSFSGGGVPTSSNATVQAWLNKIGVDGYTYPSQSKVDIYTAAWDYADAQGLTNQFDLVWLPKVENLDLVKIPFLHPVANTVFDAYNESDLELDINKGLRNSQSGNLNGYYDLKLIPRNDLIKSSQNNISIGVYVKNKITDNPLLANMISFGVDQSSGGGLGFFATASLQRLSLNGTIFTNLNNTNDSSFCSSTRQSSTQIKQYIDGILGITQSQISTLPSTLSLFGLISNSSTFSGPSSSGLSDYWLGFVYIGTGDIDQAKMNTFVNLLLL